MKRKRAARTIVHQSGAQSCLLVPRSQRERVNSLKKIPIVRWPTRRLGDLAEFRNGVNYNKSSFGEGVKVLGVSDFQNYTKPRYSELDQINPEGIVTERNILRDGDIVFVRSNGNRELIGRSLFIEQPPEEITHSAFTIRLRFTSPEVYPKFYAYCFRTPLIRKGLAAYGGGTNISNLNQDILNALEVPFPTLPVQRRIAGILSAYDELIENNRRRVRILEAVARALYREWFVNLRFPGRDKIRRGDSALAPVAKDWKGQFGDVATIERDGVNPFEFPNEEFEHFSIPAFDDGREPIIESGDTIHSSKYCIDDACVLLSKLNPRIRRVWLPNPSRQFRAIASTEFLVLKPKDGASREFIYSKCCSEDFAGQFGSLAIGTSTSHQRVKPENLLTMPTTVPDQKTVERFTEFVSPMLAMTDQLRAQMKNLRRTRDRLLPRLLSGQLEIALN
jgi:type I restriction enzyme S subunit